MKIIICCFIFGWLLAGDPAWGYDYASDLRQNCLERGLADRNICEIVQVEPLTMIEALGRVLTYRAIGWGKRFPADEDGYFIAASGEFIPKSWRLTSPDNQFHRCTYPLNTYWSAPGFAPAYPGAQYTPGAPMIEREGPSAWVVQPNNSTRDGKPPTKCFWAP